MNKSEMPTDISPPAKLYGATCYRESLPAASLLLRLQRDSEFGRNHVIVSFGQLFVLDAHGQFAQQALFSHDFGTRVDQATVVHVLRIAARTPALGRDAADDRGVADDLFDH